MAQLRTVARRLSQGLDPVGIAQQILGRGRAQVETLRAVVLARSDGGVLQPLAEQGDGTARDLTADDPLVMDCWTNEAPMQRPVDAPDGGRRIRIAVPLQVGVRMVGVVVLETERTQPGAALRELRQALAEHCVRLDTALLFDEVRTLATAEERRRLAREIHDGIAQEIASLGYAVDDLVADADSEQQREGLRGLRQELTRLTSELRLSIFDLRSEVSPTTGLGAVLSDYLRQVGSRSGLTVHLTLAEGSKRLPDAHRDRDPADRPGGDHELPQARQRPQRARVTRGRGAVRPADHHRRRPRARDAARGQLRTAHDARAGRARRREPAGAQPDHRIARHRGRPWSSRIAAGSGKVAARDRLMT